MLNFPKFFMTGIGIWRLDLKIRYAVLKKLYAIYSVIMQAYFLVFMCSLDLEFFLTCTNDKNPSELFQQLSYVIALSVVTITSLLWQKEEIREIIIHMLKEEKTIAGSEDPEVLDTYLNQVRVSGKINVAIFSLSFGVALSILLETWWRRQQVNKINATRNETLEKPFPLELYYGYDFDRERYSTLLLVTQGAACFSINFMVTATKVMFFTCIAFASMVLKTLQIKFRKYGSRNHDPSRELTALIVEHQRIIRFVTNLNESMKYIVLLEYLLNSLNVATVSVQLIVTKAASPIFFLGFLFAQIFVLGWSANEIKVQSAALANALYASRWPDQPEFAQKLILVMIVRSQRPLELTIGPFDAMTTQTALRILKASYSYITLMKNNYDQLPPFTGK
ncbi:odorant receptor 9a-like [Cylas formicarius]|uniref:odorant receptor 9a-like n=1 Tax=Cylas formicarius TaxID=197179 RepID=UPI002958A37E|nr:odorant receptor 9a-like [Cylas formicarius]